MVLANVIWAANWPYWYWLFPAYAAGGFACEALIFCYYQQNALGFRRSLVRVTLSNLTSYVTGLVLLGFFGALLPDRLFLVPQPAGYPPWERYHLIPLQFFAAYLLSVVTEGLFLRFTRWGRKAHRLMACVVLSNLASYTIIFTGYVICWDRSFEALWRWQERIERAFHHGAGA